jgi:hypothetical protein
MRSAIISAVLVFLAGATTHGECLPLTAEKALKNEVVFLGRVVDTSRTAPAGYRATFAVDSVWKGTVSKQFAVHVWEVATETPRFEPNEVYLVVAKRISAPDWRQGVGLADDAVAFTPVPCSGSTELGPTTLSDLGPGKPPQ